MAEDKAALHSAKEAEVALKKQQQSELPEKKQKQEAKKQENESKKDLVEQKKEVESTESPGPAKKVTVKRITIDGKQYLKTAANLLYDPETKEEMGIYDPATNTIKELPNESEDELSEDEYDNEA
jgi:hemolysin activation/secretion protein